VAPFLAYSWEAVDDGDAEDGGGERTVVLEHRCAPAYAPLLTTESIRSPSPTFFNANMFAQQSVGGKRISMH
jgi:hypothetical protein